MLFGSRGKLLGLARKAYKLITFLRKLMLFHLVLRAREIGPAVPGWGFYEGLEKSGALCSGRTLIGSLGA